MKIVLAPDSFKESLTATQVCHRMAIGVQAAVPRAHIVEIPMADGGEGTIDAFARAFDTTHRSVEHRITVVTGPLGSPVKACWLINGDTAVIELAQAAGIQLIAARDRQIWQAGTRGVGELLTAALDSGAHTVIIGLGGSVTSDGGIGMLSALGIRAVDATGDPVPPSAAGMRRATVLEGEVDPRWTSRRVVVAGDVDNPLCGPLGAAFVFAAQKGALPQDIVDLDHALDRWAGLLADHIGMAVTEIKDTPGAGAAGGVGAALIGVLGADMKSGADLIADLVDLRGQCRGADLVLTGEGALDSQTKHGKAPAIVAKIARDSGAPVIAFGGQLRCPPDELVPSIFDAVVSISDPHRTLEQNLAHAAENLTHAVTQAIDATLQLRQVAWEEPL